MTFPSNVDIADITIPFNTQESRIVNVKEECSDAISIQLYGPAALDVATYSISVSKDGTNFVILQSGDPAGDVSPPAVGRGRIYYDLPAYNYFKIVSSIAVTAARTWQANKQVR